MQIVVIGGGPAGCRASQLLQKKGHQVTLVDSQGAWEKPCGGGITTKALALDAELDRHVPSSRIDRITIRFGNDPAVAFLPSEPLAVVSRKALGQHLIERALREGVRVIKDRATGIERGAGRWRVTTRSRELAADFLIGADGATSFVRSRVSTPFSISDLSVTLGYFVPAAASSEMKIYFFPELEGYTWSFPRPDHVSYGLISPPRPGWAAGYKKLLLNCAIADFGKDALAEATFYSAPVPALGAEAWHRNVFAGRGWALVGDAAGLVDPITGEGIYYALRSAALLAERFPDPAAYVQAVAFECIPELARAARMRGHFYTGSFLGADLKKRMVALGRRSPAIRGVLGDLVAGIQPYAGLKGRLARAIPRVILDLALYGLSAPGRRISAN